MRYALRRRRSFFVLFCLLGLFLLFTSAKRGQPIQSLGIAAAPQPPPPEPNVQSGSLLHPKGPHTSISNPMPQSGDQKLLILLVDFSDQPGLFTGEQWQQSFFGEAGFTEYYTENSYNQLRYTGDIVGMAANASTINSASVSYIRLPHPITYYADGRYGFKTGSLQFPRNNAGVVTHALQALDAAGFDFSPYADPSTNHVENLVIIFGGRPHVYTRDPVNSLEATGYSLTASGAPEFVSTGGQRFDNFTFCPDQEGSNPGAIAHIGICVHEHGHSLGMPDLYDFSYTTSGVGRYDVMGYGAYGATSGLRPFHFGAFSKAYLGWVQTTVIDAAPAVISLQPAETAPSIIKLLPAGQATSGEYFLLENRQPLGFDRDWLSSGYCAGLYIWHIDQTVIEQFARANLVNSPLLANGPDHPGVKVVEADGGNDLIHPPLTYGACSDAWSVGQTWNSQTLPSTQLWSGAESGISLTVQSAQAGVITLAIERTNGTQTAPTDTATPTATSPAMASATSPATVTATPSATPAFATPTAVTPTVAASPATPLTPTKEPTDTPNLETPAPTPVPPTPTLLQNVTSTPQGISTPGAPKLWQIYLPFAQRD